MIPTKKLERVKDRITRECKCKGNRCPTCLQKGVTLDIYAESNIPVDYWFKVMSKFEGDQVFKDDVVKYMTELDTNYDLGRSLCFQGQVGVGKTLAACSILKTAIKRDFSAYYIIMGEILDSLNDHSVKRKLKNVDFLVIDELDSRFFGSELSKEVVGAAFEGIFRSRTHNLLPTIVCTNNSDFNDLFKNVFSTTFESLSEQFLDTLVVRGQDFRKQMGASNHE